MNISKYRLTIHIELLFSLITILLSHLLAITLLSLLLSYFTKEESSKALGNQQGFNISETKSTSSAV